MADWREPKTDWKDSDPIGRADLKRIEENTLYLYELARDAKTLIIAALNTMNQSPPSGATFEQLAAAIEAISTDATAVPSDVISGRTFYSGGIKRTGTAQAEVLS